MGQSTSYPRSSNGEVEIEKLEKFYDHQFEKELALLNLESSRKRALQLSERREQLAWETMAVGTMTGVLLIAGSIYKRKDLVIPVVPLVMGIGWRYDCAYGQNQETIRDRAEKLMRSESNKFRTIGGPITLAELDKCI